MLESLFNKVASHQACNFIKKRPQHWPFPVNITKFLRTPILKNICERLPLQNFLWSINKNITVYYIFIRPSRADIKIRFYRKIKL